MPGGSQPLMPFRTMLEAAQRILYVQSNLPTTCQIEVTNRCNLSCPMCPRLIYKVPLVHMDFSLFTKVVDKLRGVRDITLTGWGEPFCHPRILDMVAYCKHHRHRVHITTNGVLLTKERISRLAALGLDSISFSIDSIKGTGKGHHEQKVVNNIRAVAVARQRPLLTIQTTIHHGHENDVYDIIRFAASVRADSVNLIRLDTRFVQHLKRPRERDEQAIFRTAERLGKKLGIRVDMVQYALFTGMVRTGFKMCKSLLHRGGRYCPKPFNHVYVNVKGDVTPCCSLPKLALGNLMNATLSDIWQSERFRRFRRSQRAICQGCDMLLPHYTA